MYREFKNTLKSIGIIFLCGFFFFSGLPFSFLIDLYNSNNIIDNLYISLQNNNVIDQKARIYFGPKKVRSANFSMQTGYYVGNGSILSISGIGFKPDFLIIKSNTNAIAAVFKTSAMSENVSAHFSATADNEANEIIFNDDGFTIGKKDRIAITDQGFNVTQSMNLTLPGVRYTYVAFTGSDCSSTGNFCVGSYIGNGSNPRDINIGFTPTFVMIKRSTAVAAHFRTAANPSNETLYFTATVRDTSGNMIRSFPSNSFQVGSTDNTLNGLYYFVAFRDTSGFMTHGSYTANNTDNRSITGLGFKPDFVFVKNATNATSGNTTPVFSIPENYGDHSSFFAATANTTNYIQALETDGFQVGNNIAVNGSASDTMYYVAFGGSANFSAGGDFYMDTGSYTGNGTNLNITGLKFSPDLVIIKANTAQISAFRTKLMVGDTTYSFGASATLTNAILDLNNDGFSLGNNATVNSSGVTYQWQAFGNAFNPHSNTGSEYFAIGYYIGNQVDNRDVRRIPFQPDLVVTKSNQAYTGAFRTSAMSGDLTNFFTATAETSDYIQALYGDGFQLGTSSGTSIRASNYAGYLYHWFAFRQNDYFKIGSYTGNGADNRNINNWGINPNLVWIKRTTAVNGVFRSDSLTGDTSQYFLATANAADKIQSLITGGVQVGTGGEVNTSSGIYRYVAWTKPPNPIGVPGTPGTPSFSNTESGKLTLNWTSASGASYYKIERAIELGGVIQRFKEVDKTTNTTYTDSDGIGGNFTYWYRVVGINANGQGDFSASASVTTPAQNARIQTGYYIGNQGKITVSNLGFTPEFLIIKSSTNSTAAVFETTISSSLINADVHSFAATADNQISNLNLANVHYTYIAIAGQDCSSSGSMCLGYYTGDNTNPRNINTGFTPSFVMVKRSTGVEAHFKTATNPDNETLYFAATVRNTSGNMIRSFPTNSFQVGSTNNVLNGTYYYIAFKNTSNFFQEGTYTANNTDNRSITGVGFAPDFVVVKNATNTTAANTNPSFNVLESYGDYSSYFSATANATNNIQALESDGFQVGNSIFVNGSAGDTMYYLAFKGNQPPTTSGNFSMATGSYTGSGVKQSITGLGFSPDLVIIKDNAANQSVFRTSLMGSNSTGFWSGATANGEGAILSLDSDGFTIGTHVSVNANTNTYHWQAFGNALSPHNNSGSSDFAIGAYYGNGIDNRNIDGLAYSFNFILVKSFTNAGAATWRTSEMSGDLSTVFGSANETSNSIQELNSNNFQIGTNATVNTAATVYFWIGFKTGDNFKVGSYSGDSNDNRDLNDWAISPDLVWIKRTTSGVNAVFRSVSLSGDSSQYFHAASNVSDRIQNLISGGVQLGSNADVNASGSTYRYVAWKIPVIFGNLFVDIVDQNGDSVTNPGISFSLVETTFACQNSTAIFGTNTQRIRVSNQSSNPQWDLTLAALLGATTTWLSNLNDRYDFNDPTSSGCGDGGDADLYAGQMSIDFSNAVITPQSGCSNTGLSFGSNSAFSEGVINDILLVSAGASAQTSCYWDITGLEITQTIPNSQAYGNYSINMNLSVIAN